MSLGFTRLPDRVKVQPGCGAFVPGKTFAFGRTFASWPILT